MQKNDSSRIQLYLKALQITLCSFITLLALSGCMTPQIGLPEGTESTVDMNTDVYIKGHNDAAFRVYDERFDLIKSKTNIWQRIRSGFAMQDLETESVTEKELWYSSRPNYFTHTTARAQRYLYYIVEEIEKRNMPMELALLPFLESAYNPEAVSSAQAAGMWQFIPSTGLNFQLQQDIFRDERRDVIASTTAALDYLQKLYNMFGDWHLALAAYNWGEGNVQRAINNNRRQNKPTDYVNLNMPNETQGYVPTLQALKNVITDPTAFDLNLPEIKNHPFFQVVAIEKDIDVNVIVQLAEITPDEFKALNPAINKPVVLAAITPQILLPWDNADLFMTKLKTFKSRLSSWTVWKAPRTMSVAQVAAATKNSERTLREVNDIPPAVFVKQGSILLIRNTQNENSNVTLALIQNAKLDFTRVGAGRMLTPSKIPVSEQSQNATQARRPMNRNIRSPQRNANRTTTPSKVAVAP